MAFYRTSDRSI